jgi:deoxyhypusine synthase
MELKPVKHLKIARGMKTSQLVDEMKETAYNARALSLGAEIWQMACKDKKCKKFFGFAGALVPGGMKQIVIDMLNEKMIDVLVSTGANLTHDLIEALGFNHYQGSEKMDDKILAKKGIDRIYNVFMKSEVYQELEKWFIKNFDKINATSNSEFLFKIGEILYRSGNKNAKNSILATCYKNQVSCFVPALSDSGIGLMIWNVMLRKKKPLMQEYNDLHKMLDIAWTNKKKAVFYVGGGVPKNYIQQAMQFSSPALYGVQITTDSASYGGSSGAPLCEGISWGKMNAGGKFVDVHCDATIALPLIFSFLRDKLK